MTAVSTDTDYTVPGLRLAQTGFHSIILLYFDRHHFPIAVLVVLLGKNEGYE